MPFVVGNMYHIVESSWSIASNVDVEKINNYCHVIQNNLYLMQKCGIVFERASTRSMSPQQVMKHPVCPAYLKNVLRKAIAQKYFRYDGNRSRFDPKLVLSLSFKRKYRLIH